MNTKRDIERAKEEGPFRDGHRGTPPAPEGKQWIKCLFPPCNKQVLVEKEATSPIVSSKPKQMTLPFCKVHGEMCMFMMWLLPQVRIQQGVTPGGIVVPGQGQPKMPGVTGK